MKVYLVKGNSGDYDLESTWLAKAFVSKQKAEKYLQELNVLASKVTKEIKKDHESGSPSGNPPKSGSQLEKIDPNATFLNYPGVFYSAEELEVVE